MSKKIWVHGPISRDVMVRVDRVPKAGELARSQASEKRIGGSGANIACGLATTGIPTSFITWIGDDALGVELRSAIESQPLHSSVIHEFEGPSGEVAILIDSSGERTIIGLAPSQLEKLTIEGAEIAQGDILFFTLWRKNFLPQLISARERGCIVAVGASALDDEEIPGADLVIGSVHDYSGTDPLQLLDRFTTIVLTDGVHGATAYRKDEVIHVDAVPAQAIDTTGAGDAFIAGYLASYFHGLNVRRCLEIGALWGAAAVEVNSSIPPDFAQIRKRGAIEF